MKYNEEIYLIDQGEFPLSTPASSHAFANQHSVAKLADKRIVENQTQRERMGKDGEEEREGAGGRVAWSLALSVRRRHSLRQIKCKQNLI